MRQEGRARRGFLSKNGGCRRHRRLVGEEEERETRARKAFWM